MKKTLTLTITALLAITLAGCVNTPEVNPIPSLTVETVTAGDWKCDGWGGEHTHSTPYEREGTECLMFSDEENILVIPEIKAGDYK